MTEKESLRFTQEEQDDASGRETADSADTGKRLASKTNTQRRRSASRRLQRKQIKREYAAAKTGKAARFTGGAPKRARLAVKRPDQFIRRRGRGLIPLGLLALMLTFLLNAASSCSVMLGSFGSAATAYTFSAEDGDLLDAEETYCALEGELKKYLEDFEDTYDYDEYNYDLDEIGHDPYVLLSLLSATETETWTLEGVWDKLQMLFERQYTLTVETETETRYRVETVTGTRKVKDPETGEEKEEKYEYEAEVPYTWSICNVALENFDLSHLPVYLLKEDELGRYAGYMGALGNRPDLFPDSPYVAKYTAGYTKYDIPQELMQDERFAAIIREGKKYLGYPYVWGGSSPATSFDCSGFVSWVLDHSGWSIGRLGADGLYGICTPVPAAAALPGDLVFFSGTYDTPGMSHVGIYVGGGMMLHCGDPISYADLRSDYWQAHLAAYGRLPEKG